MSDLLFECFSEEIPARMQLAADAQLRDKLVEALAAARLAHGAVESFSSPRHLAVIVRGLPAQQPDQTIERKGPKAGAPDAAIDGFCQSAGIARSELILRGEGKDAVYFAIRDEKGQPTADALRAILENILQGFHWPKSMRWGDHAIQWARPLQRLLCLFDGQVIPVQFGHLVAGNITHGHRFLAPEPIKITSADEYVPALTAACVQVERNVRRELIAAQLAELAGEHGLELVEDAALLDEVTGLVEWPTVLCGRFDEDYLRLPPEVLISEMREHQKYFACRVLSSGRGGPPTPPLKARADALRSDASASEGLPPHHTIISNQFLVVANLPTADGGAAIVHGNGRVLRARLEDGAFYWESDRAVPLSDWAEKLGGMIFHAKLGTIRGKTERMEALAPLLAVFVPRANLSLVARAALLAKADLTTGMVGEFPELQGIMGRYYALAQGEDASVADAIAEHYAPQGAGDNVPTAPLSMVVALADKLDSLAGLFAANEKPTGSKDPFALRRAALGVIRIILENALRMPLNIAIDKAVAQYHGIKGLDKAADVVPALVQFFAERLKAMLKERGIRHDVIAAVMAGGDDDLVRIVAKATALQDLLAGEDGANLLAAYRRAHNILSAEEKKSQRAFDGDIEDALLEGEAESALATRLTAMQAPLEAALEAEDFTAAMRELAALRAPLDAYFAAVMVNCDEADRRENRLNTLGLLCRNIHAVADFSVVE